MVSACLDLAESRARRKIPVTMQDWAKRPDIFLSAGERGVLQDAGGRITAKTAKARRKPV
ncbi:MAG: virulence RhuM family protein [Deltaproteobacteria bacterium]|nr:virulence RhuM family protein [Deltaproteobacteria bacterium]